MTTKILEYNDRYSVKRVQTEYKGIESYRKDMDLMINFKV